MPMPTPVSPLPDIFRERSARYGNAIALKQEGSICIAPQIMFLPIYMYGETTVQAVMEDYRNCIPSWLRYHEEFQPDLYWAPGSILPKRPLETLDCRYARWPGRHVDANASFQLLDHEFMSADEYVEYAEDPTGFVLRRVLPRHYGQLQGLEQIDLAGAVFTDGIYSMIPFATPQVRQALDAMTKAGAEAMDYAQALGEIGGMFAERGWPSALDSMFEAPFDMFNDLLRGLLNATMDVVTCPDELLLALETATRVQVRRIRTYMQQNPWAKSIYFFLHNGSDIFMSPDAFGTFYWPGLKACIEAIVELGGTPGIFLEEKYDQKLDYLADVPKGRVLYHFTGGDLRLVKQKLGGIACISGGVDGVLLQHGSPEQVERNVRETLDICMQDGGYFLDTTVPLDLAKPENLHTLFDTARKYGVY